MPKSKRFSGIDGAFESDDLMGYDRLAEIPCSTIISGHIRTNGGGKKADVGKPPLSMIDPEFNRAMAHVLKMGEAKYGEKNWMQGLNYSWLIDSAKRHIDEFAEGKVQDEESGQSPLANAACCMMMLCWFQRNGFDDCGFDDRRFKKVSTDAASPESKKQNPL